MPTDIPLLTACKAEAVTLSRMESVDSETPDRWFPFLDFPDLTGCTMYVAVTASRWREVVAALGATPGGVDLLDTVLGIVRDAERKHGPSVADVTGRHRRSRKTLNAKAAQAALNEVLRGVNDLCAALRSTAAPRKEPQ